MARHVEIMRDAGGSVVSVITAAVDAVVVDEDGARRFVRFPEGASADERLALLFPVASATETTTPRTNKKG